MPMRYVLAAALALVVTIPLGVAAADPPAAAAPGAGEIRDVGAITLVTGDVVNYATLGDGHAVVSVVPREGAVAPHFAKHEKSGHVYVVPSDVATLVPERLDWSLFDVTLLADLGYTDASTDAVPLVVDRAAGSTGPITLPGVDRTGTSAAKAETSALGAALASAASAAPGTATALDGIDRIRLAGAPAGAAGPSTTAPEGQQLVTLTVNGIARDGRPAGGISTVDVINVDDQSLYTQIGIPFSGGSATFSVPPGRYAVLGYLFTYDEPSVYAYEGVATFEPEVVVEGNTTVTLDAQGAVPIEIEKPDPTEPTTTTLSYYRSDALGASYSHSYTLSTPINTVFANPTQPVATGDFEFYSQHSLVAPDITAEVVEPEDRPIAADYVFNSAKLDGTFHEELVYAGLGRVADFEGLDVEGKIALVQRGEITFLEKIQNAQDAGADLVMLFNNVPGLLLVSGDPSLIPAMSMSQAEGEALVELTETGTVMVHLEAVMTSPYLYDLVLPEPDVIPETLHYVVDDSTSATASIGYRSHVPEQPVGELRHKWRPWEVASFGFLRQMQAPLKRVEHITAGDTRYEQYFWAHSTLELPFDLPMYAPIVTYEPGEQVSDTWMKQVVAPAAVLPDDIVDGGSAYRLGDDLVLNIPDFVDSRAHWGFSAAPYDTSAFRLYEEDELVASGGRASGTFPVGPGPAEYRIELDVDREAPGWVYSASTRTRWTVQSETTSGPEKLPVINVDWRLRLDMLQQKRPHKPHLIGWDVQQQDGSATSPITGSQLWVSYDEGGTWAEVADVAEPKDGWFRAHLPEPPAGATTASLRVTAADEAGSTVSQEVVPAYAIAAAGD